MPTAILVLVSQLRLGVKVFLDEYNSHYSALGLINIYFRMTEYDNIFCSSPEIGYGMTDSIVPAANGIRWITSAVYISLCTKSYYSCYTIMCMKQEARAITKSIDVPGLRSRECLLWEPRFSCQQAPLDQPAKLYRREFCLPLILHPLQPMPSSADDVRRFSRRKTTIRNGRNNQRGHSVHAHANEHINETRFECFFFYHCWSLTSHTLLYIYRRYGNTPEWATAFSLCSTYKYWYL